MDQQDQKMGQSVIIKAAKGHESLSLSVHTSICNEWELWGLNFFFERSNILQL